MTKLIGGPYDGQDMPYEPRHAPYIRMPDADTVEDSNDATADTAWPHIYEADLTVEPPVYRYIRSEFGRS